MVGVITEVIRIETAIGVVPIGRTIEITMIEINTGVTIIEMIISTGIAMSNLGYVTNVKEEVIPSMNVHQSVRIVKDLGIQKTGAALKAMRIQ